MKGRIKAVVSATIDRCFREGFLQDAPIPDYVIEVPNNPEHGDFATNLPLTLASSQKRPPKEIASVLVENLQDMEGLIEKVDVAGPGFINFVIRRDKWLDLLESIIGNGTDYGKNSSGKAKKVLVEFVSANPTGPLHLGHGRGAALGDTLCRIMSSCGYRVVREFYINDAGRQVKLLGDSIYSRLKQMHDPGYPFPENGYNGSYILELAKSLAHEIRGNERTEEEAIKLCAERGKELMLEDIKADLSLFRVEFESWFSESKLYSSGSLDLAMEDLRKEGLLYEREGALWIRTSNFGDDKDRVILKQDGQATYFASDIAYHLDKYKRGYEKVIDIWGADHHGYVPRMFAALSARGIAQDWLSVMLIQLVKLWQGGKEIKMSKRAGDFVTLKELIDEVGVDSARFFFLTKSHDSTLDFDIDLVKRQDSDNPVYYVQYAHARICSVFRKAEEEGIQLPEEIRGVLARLVLEEEMALIRYMAGFPSLLKDIADTLEAHRLIYYLTELAALFHKYFNLGNKSPEYRIVTPDSELSRARLLLVKAVRIVLANGLKLLGVEPPERM